MVRAHSQNPQPLSLMTAGGWRALSRSSFLRNSSVLSAGQAGAAAVAIAAAPILGRLYPPAEYGILALYMGMAAALGTISNWQYSQAVVIERYDAKAFALVRLCLITSALTSLLAALLVGLIFAAPFCFPALQNASLWFLLLPLSTLIAGSVAAFSAAANRAQRYRDLARIPLETALLTISLSIALGLRGWGVAGLLTSYIAGQMYQLLAFAHVYRSLPGSRVARGRLRLLALARKHRGFPIWTTPSSFVGVIAQQIPIYALGWIGAVAAVGAFSRARQLLSLPVGLVGGAVGQVFRQRAAADIAARGTCLPIYRKTLLALLLLGTPPVLLLMVAAPPLFEIFLGPNWREAGDVARVIAPLLLLQLVCSPLSSMFYIRAAQKEDFCLQTTFALLTIALVSALVAAGMSPLHVVVGYTLSQSIMYAAYLLRSYQLARVQ